MLYSSLSLTATARFAGIVQGVVVQIANAAPERRADSSGDTCSHQYILINKQLKEMKSAMQHLAYIFSRSGERHGYIYTS